MEFQDIGVREVLTRAWTAFAASGNPGLDWTPVSCTYMYSDVLKQGTPVSLVSCPTRLSFRTEKYSMKCATVS